jgi:hypothetical protein
MIQTVLVALILALSPQALAQETGDIFVTVSGGASGRIHLDGLDMGSEAPATLRNVAVGSHKVQVKGDCVVGTQTVDVAADRVTRTELVLQPRGGFVEVQVDPEFAEILLDGAIFGTGPRVATEVPCGPHILQIEAIGFLTETRPLQVSMGSVHRLEVSLKSKEGKGSLSLLVDPVHTETYLDQVHVATGPITLDDIQAGHHEMVFLAEGYKRHEERIAVLPNEVTRVEITLESMAPAAPEVAPPPPEAPPKAPGAVPVVATPAPSSTPLPPPEAVEPLETKGSIARPITGAVMIAAGFGAGFYSGRFKQVAWANYATYQELIEDGDEGANDYYDTNVQRDYRRTVGFAIGGAVLITGGLVTVFATPDGTSMIGVSGRF